jgi:hypothetical protein
LSKTCIVSRENTLKHSMSAFISGSRMAIALGGTGGGGIALSELGASLGVSVDFICEDAFLGAFDILRGLGLGAMKAVKRW